MITGAVTAEATPIARPQGAERSGQASDQDAGLRRVAEEFEVMFIAEMLKAAKVGEVGGPFTGGHGEEAFRSFLVREYAEAIGAQGGLGMADQLYRDLQQKVAING